MVQTNRHKISQNPEIDIASQFTAQSGLIVDTHNDIWILSPLGKGRTVDVSWLHKFDGCALTKGILFDTLIHYAETKTAATVSTQIFAVRDAFPHAFETLEDFKLNWQQLRNSAKKTLKGFMTTCVTKLNHKYLYKHYEITNTYQHKPRFNALHPTKGRLTDYEYDSILHNIRTLSAQLPTNPSDDLNFYQSQGAQDNLNFSYFKKIMSYRFMIQIARRPKQIATLKWCDVLPVGASFVDTKVDYEPTFTGAKSLHVRSFKIKQSSDENCFRASPEKWTIPLSESFSLMLLKYRNLYEKGLSLTLNIFGDIDTNKTAKDLIGHCPIFPRRELFNADFTNQDVIRALMNKDSTLFHLSEGDIRGYESRVSNGLSERHGTVRGSNNRLRHTWLCNAALEGKPIQDISKITNVTIPAARHYLQLGLKERQFIDENYAANPLLREAFNPIPITNVDDELIQDQVAGPVGVETDKPTCQTCEHKTLMVRPIPCYGCANFRPILDADHEAVLEQALSKIEFLDKFGTNKSNSGAYIRLTKAIAYIKLTIAVCNEEKLKQSGLSEKQ